VVAEGREEARQKVIQNCGMVMGGNIHSTLPDEEVNFPSDALNNSWAFSMHLDIRTGRITVKKDRGGGGGQLRPRLLSFVSFGRTKKGAKKPR